MPLWTLWDKTKPPAQAVIREHEDSPNTADGSIPANLDESLAWLVETHNAQPAYDPQAEKLQRDNGVVAIDPNDPRTGTRTWGWSKVALSDQELRDAARRNKLASDSATVGAIVDKWRDDNTVLTQSDVGKVIEFIALRDGLDEQAHQV